ncbi:MAG: hypothetical protein JWO89_1151 [Verrucomicrobiaceae bacterium]|nr:hypothetical protein [Verrucomicrobiaceae bacterium]MDB6118312.1 hypothetical protein [Verrucomicrobiaceae bacterium]
MKPAALWFFRLASLFFGGVFVYAGVLKLRDPLLFQKDIESFDLMGDPWTAILAVSLPWMELLAGVAVITGLLRNGGLLLLNLSLLTFFAAIGSAWYRGLNIECGCFGGDAVTPSYVELFIRDGLLLALGLVLLWKETRAARTTAFL